MRGYMIRRRVQVTCAMAFARLPQGQAGEATEEQVGEWEEANNEERNY